MERFDSLRVLRVFALSLLFTGVLTLFVQRGAAQEVVVASTSLTGAIAKAAGAREVRVLTTGDISHPPEYDLKPSDVLKFEGANIVVYAGYEKMVPKLLETSRSKNLLALRIDTTTSPENLMTQARKMAEILKNEQEERAWEQRFLAELKDLQKKLSPFLGKRAIVHLHAQPFSRWAGLNVVQVIPAGELTPKSVADAIAQKPELVVDILHFPVAKMIAENAKCRYVQVINFPGVDNTVTLEDIFKYNSNRLVKSFQ
jgi:zinc transport system substrate-binding protein